MSRQKATLKRNQGRARKRPPCCPSVKVVGVLLPVKLLNKLMTCLWKQYREYRHWQRGTMAPDRPRYNRGSWKLVMVLRAEGMWTLNYMCSNRLYAADHSQGWSAVDNKLTGWSNRRSVLSLTVPTLKLTLVKLKPPACINANFQCPRYIFLLKPSHYHCP